MAECGYPARACTVGVKQCLRVCGSVCESVCLFASKNYWKMLQAGYLRHFEMLYSTKPNQHNHIGTFLYPIQVKVVLFTTISATSYYQFLGSTPFEFTCSSYGQQLTYMKGNRSGGDEEAWGISIPWIHSSYGIALSYSLSKLSR